MKAALALVVIAAVAHADTSKAIGEGYTIVSNGSGIDVVKGARRAALYRTGEPVDAKVDAKARKLTYAVEMECEHPTLTFTFDQLEARLVNAEALVLHHKKDWAHAAAGFTKAAALDPRWNLPAYNAASAFTEAGDHKAALLALDPWFETDALKTFIQVTNDPELRPLLAESKLRQMHASKPGTATVEKAEASYSKERFLVALRLTSGHGMACGVTTTLQIHDLTTGAFVGYLPLDDSSECDPAKVRHSKAYAANAKIADQLLADLGFVPTTITEQAVVTRDNADDDKQKASFPKAKLGVVTKAGKASVYRGNTKLGMTIDVLSRMTGARYLGDLKLVAVSTTIPSDVCEQDRVDLIPLN